MAGQSQAGTVYTAKQMLARLVQFDTTSHKSNLALIAFVEDYLAGHGVASTRVPTPDGEKASLYATIGPEGAAGVGLSAHSDVVPVTGQAWDSDPFTIVERDGRLYGRGTADMKGFLACMLVAVPDFKRRALKTPVHLLISYDEEVGCIGVRPMIAELGRTLVTPRMVIVGEPTSMMVVDAHKGPARWHVEVTGRAAHSSMAPLGVNAISVAAQLIGELARMEEELAERPRDLRFDPPYATLQVTRIEGGEASNIVPTHCWFGWEVRALPGVDPAALERRFKRFAEERCLPAMRLKAPEADIRVTCTNLIPPFASGAGSDVVALALKLTGQNETFAVSYATEAGLFQDGGAPSVVCGPGDIAQAHTANEWIAVSQLAACQTFLERLADWCEA